MKKEQIKVKIESVEQSKKFEKILLALGETLADNYSMEKDRHNFLIYSPEKTKGDEYGWVCFTDDVNLKEITLGQLIDMLNEPKKIAVKVGNEKEFHALMEYYDSLGYVWEHGEKPNGYKCKINFPCFIPFESEFVAVSGVVKWEDYAIITFTDFAKEHNIKLPLIKSEDGVWLYEGDELFEVNKRNGNNNWYLVDANNGLGYWTVGKSAEKWKLSEKDGYVSKAFSTKQAALDWIESQKPKEIPLQLSCDRHFAVIDKSTVKIKIGYVYSDITYFLSHADIRLINETIEKLS